MTTNELTQLSTETIIASGYTFDPSTRKLTFQPRPCTAHGCVDGKTKTYPSCPNYGKPVNKHIGRKCPICGAKNKNSHGRLPDAEGNPTVKWTTCYTCEGTGIETPNFYTSLDLTALIPTFEFVIFAGRKTFNDEYLGLGNFGGVTGYTAGAYATLDQCVAHMTREKYNSFDYTQAGNLVGEDGIVPDTIYIKTNGYGYTSMLAGTKFGR